MHDFPARLLLGPLDLSIHNLPLWALTPSQSFAPQLASGTLLSASRSFLILLSGLQAKMPVVVVRYSELCGYSLKSYQLPSHYILPILLGLLGRLLDYSVVCSTTSLYEHSQPLGRLILPDGSQSEDARLPCPTLVGTTLSSSP
ncbi:Hypothetical protein NTJ_15033 [Nesidiocoris tenuis]|uniref:Uncharacterized protein n=1 Tax=Nesidiocoris tenuis TaxID=355587 RepID=A0ABN7BED8_9HEMI|nr:Hypothetical protein NTJ_15033 [Nesidiocoris tenuis]